MKRCIPFWLLVLSFASMSEGAVITLRPTIDALVTESFSPINDPPFFRIDVTINSTSPTLTSSYTTSNGGLPFPTLQASTTRRIELVFDLTTIPAGTILGATLFWSEAADNVSNRGGTLNRHQLEGYLDEDFILPYNDTPNQGFPVISSQVANGTLNSLIQQDVTSTLAGIVPMDVSAKFVITPEEPYTTSVFGISSTKVDPYSIHSRLAIPSLQPGLIIEVVPEIPSSMMVLLVAMGLLIVGYLKCANTAAIAAD
jgi:hypothetical protein